MIRCPTCNRFFDLVPRPKPKAHGGNVMLVLRRREGESLVIITPQGDLRISIEGAPSVKLKIEGPREIKVLRSEILDNRMCDQTRAEIGVGA